MKLHENKTYGNLKNKKSGLKIIMQILFLHHSFDVNNGIDCLLETLGISAMVDAKTSIQNAHTSIMWDLLHTIADTRSLDQVLIA